MADSGPKIELEMDPTSEGAIEMISTPEDVGSGPEGGGPGFRLSLVLLKPVVQCTTDENRRASQIAKGENMTGQVRRREGRWCIGTHVQVFVADG